MSADGAFSMLLTPPGAGAIALIRVTGQGAPSIVQRLFRKAPSLHRSGSCHTEPIAPGKLREASPVENNQEAAEALSRVGDAEPIIDRRPRHGLIVEHEEVLDDVVVSASSFAGVPLVDICTHGGVRVVERILTCLEREGAPLRQSRAGDAWPASTRIEHDATSALQNARTWRAVQFLAWQRQHLPAALAELADLCHADPVKARGRLEDMIVRYDRARFLIGGLTVALIGPPNSGKSTLFNRLVGRQAAVVSPIAGTTRDWVQAEMEFDGVPLTLLDTPGQHDTADTLEQAALASTAGRVAAVDAAVLVLDSAAALPPNLTHFVAGQGRHARMVVLNKSDCRSAWSQDSLPAAAASWTRHLVSALTGAGIAQLLRDLVSIAGAEIDAPALFTPEQVATAKEVAAMLRLNQSLAASDKLKQKFLSISQDSPKTACL